MIEILIGRAGTGKTFACLEEMKKILTYSPLETEIIYLLPAYQTYRAELELAAITGGAVNTRMESFNRFARQILSEVGGAIVPRISEIGRRLLLRKILLRRDKEGKIAYFNRAAKQRGFAESLADELKELRTYSIDSEKLRAATFDVKDEELAKKLSDLAMFLEDFRAEIFGKQNDDEDLLEKASEFIPHSESVKRAEIFIDGFIFFDLQQRKILRQIFSYAKNVHIVLPMDTNLKSRENIDELGLFNRSFRTFEMIKKMADEVGEKVIVKKFDEPRRFENPALKILEQKFFEYAPKKFNGEISDFEIVEAVNKRVEIEAAARKILELHKCGYRFREMGILLRDETYENLFKPIFDLHGIPFFVDTKRAAAHHPLAELLRSVLELLRGWRAESVFRCLRTGFFPAAQEEIDLLENYVLEFGLRGEKIWTSGTAWNWWRRENFDSEKDEPSEEELQRMTRVNEIREKVIEPIKNFSASVKKITKNQRVEVGKMTEVLYDFVEELNVSDKLAEWSDAEEKKKNLALSKEHLKIWDDAIKLFEQLSEILGTDEISLREFETIINEGLDALQMSIIPPGLDEVTIAKFDQNSLQNSRAIFLMGFSDGQFPRAVGEKGLLSDADRLYLTEDAKLEISKGGRETILAEKFLQYRGLNESREFLQISYPLADSEGKAMHPSSLLKKIRELLPQTKFEQVGLDVLQNLGSEIEFSVGGRELSAVTAGKLYAPNRKMSGSVTKFESFNKCPFNYFANYGLKIYERREYEMKPPDLGTLLHSVMRRFGEDLKAENNRRWATVEQKELSERVDKILEELAPRVKNKILSSSKAYAHRLERIKKVAKFSLSRLIELDKTSEFHPQYFEESFGRAGMKPLVYNLDGVELELVGQIDRIDFSEGGKYFLIIDYKTGDAYVNLAEIYQGLNVQLLTYLTVTDQLEKVGKRLPAGMLYFFLKYPPKSAETVEEALSEIQKSLKMPGWVLADPQVVSEIDKNQNFIKVRLSKNGIHGGDKANVKTAEEFQTLMRYVGKILQYTGKNILNGDISVRPFKDGTKDACKNCPYSAVCNFDPFVNQTLSLLNLDNEEILRRMAQVK